MQRTQDEIDQRIRTLQSQEALHLQEVSKLRMEIEEKSRIMKNLEVMLNSERTQSLVEISQLREALLRKKQFIFTNPVFSAQKNTTNHFFHSINETPIKAKHSPIKETNEEESQENNQENNQDNQENNQDNQDRKETSEGEENQSQRRREILENTSTTNLSEVLSNLSEAVSKLEEL